MKYKSDNKYCLDTNIFIEAKNRYYSFDFASGFWSLLEELYNLNFIDSSVAVYDEIMKYKESKKNKEKGKKEDPLIPWAKKLKPLFSKPDKEEQKNYQNIINYYQDYNKFDEFARCADPWVISHALTYDLIVVTHEHYINNPQKATKINIPNVCEIFHVECCNTFEMINNFEINFGLEESF